MVSFSVVTTIGFGDYAATTLIGRIGTIIIGLYGIIIVALIPGVVVSYYMDFIQTKSRETIAQFLEKLEHLEDLSSDELKAISTEVKTRKYTL